MFKWRRRACVEPKTGRCGADRISVMTGFFWRLRGAATGEREVRAEIWRLGTRHFGRPLEGALGELKAPGLSSDRAQLLRACVRKLQSD